MKLPDAPKGHRWTLNRVGWGTSPNFYCLKLKRGPFTVAKEDFFGSYSESGLRDDVRIAADRVLGSLVPTRGWLRKIQIELRGASE